MTSRVIVSIRVPCSPIQAFEVFVEEIGDWWVHDGAFKLTPRSPGRLAFEEPGENGRLVEVLPNGKVFEVGEIRGWKPGELLIVGWRQATFGPEHATEVEVRFEPVGAETRVTVEHRGWDTVPQEHVARHQLPLQRFLQMQGDQWKAGLSQFSNRAGENYLSREDDPR